jgi:serine/threonine protein kinase
MLFGCYPFEGYNAENILKNIIQRKWNQSIYNHEVSVYCKDLVSRMLEADPGKRINWVEIYQHPALHMNSANLNINMK